MANLIDQYIEDRNITRTMVLATFERDNVPQEMIDEYFEAYDRETDIGKKIAAWLDANRLDDNA